MKGHFWQLFLTQFCMLFHMVLSVLLSMVAFSTTFWFVEILQQPIRFFDISGYWSYHGKQNRGYHVKGQRKLCQRQLLKVTLHFVWGHPSRKQTVVLLPALVYERRRRLVSKPSLGRAVSRRVPERSCPPLKTLLHPCRLSSLRNPCWHKGWTKLGRRPS